MIIVWIKVIICGLGQFLTICVPKNEAFLVFQKIEANVPLSFHILFIVYERVLNANVCPFQLLELFPSLFFDSQNSCLFYSNSTYFRLQFIELCAREKG